MASVNKKDIPEKQNLLGQYFTPETTVDFCLSRTEITTNFVIEPSCGIGNFMRAIRQRWPRVKVLGFEVDESFATPDPLFFCVNFYDWQAVDTSVTFIGNPPFRTPAASVTSDPVYGRKELVHALANKYNVTGIREESVFFILKSVDLLLCCGKPGHIYYILPKSIFQNNSRAYKTFHLFLNNYVRLAEVWDLGQDFDKVTTDLCYVHFVVDGSRSDTFLWNGQQKDVNSFYGVNEDLIPFQRIFKKTYLGSVPCESVLLSVRDEPREHFKDRLHRLMTYDIKEDNLLDHLSYQGNVHLVSLKKKDEDKIKVVLGYVQEIKSLLDSSEFLNDDLYKTIQHRNEIRYYFRHKALTKAKFVYQLNPNPTYSFYFPGNPVKGCLDYHGYCDYDCNRNCSPSANRTVPVYGIEDNLTDEFKLYWDNNTGLPYNRVFDYLSHVLKSDWYQQMKNQYQRFYFGIPKEFDKRFLSNQ